MNKYEFSPNFKTLLDEFSFGSPLSAKIKDGFDQLLGGPSGLLYQQTISGSDAIYLPSKSETSKGANLAKYEEYFHLQQLRGYRCGWYLEFLKRKFAEEVYNYKNNSSNLGEVSEKWKKYKKYHQWTIVPLEFQFRCRCIYTLNHPRTNPDMDAENYFKLGDPFSPHFTHQDKTLDEIKFPEKFVQINQKAFFMELAGSPLIEDQLEYESKAGLIINWMQKVGKAIMIFFKELSESTSIRKLIIAITGLAAFYEFPSMLALDPSFETRFLKNDFPKSESLTNPTKRFFQILRGLLKVKTGELSSKFQEAYSKGEAKYCDLDTVFNFLIKYPSKGGFIKLYPTPLSKEDVSKRINKLNNKEVSNFNLLPIIPLRYQRTLKQDERGNVNKYIDQDFTPSIKITKRNFKEKKEKEGFIAEINIDDVISRQLFRELVLTYEGINLLNKS